jgi:hypothetical protein
MKKLSFRVLLALVISLNLVSCRKEPDSANANNEKLSVSCPRLAALKEQKTEHLYKVSTFAGQKNSSGNTDGVLCKARFGSYLWIAVAKDGTLYVSDLTNHRIRKITPEGMVSTFCGGTKGYADGKGAEAKFNEPRRIIMGIDGNLYVCDAGNKRIRKITPEGVVSTFAANAGDIESESLDMGKDGYLYVSAPNGIQNSINKISPEGIVTKFAGGSVSGDRDGTKADALFTGITDIEFSSDGSLYIAELSNRKVKKITPEGMVVTVAGGTFGFNDGQGKNAQLDGPNDLDMGPNGEIYVGNFCTLRKITADGYVTTLAGHPVDLPGKTEDGVGKEASFAIIKSLAVAGNHIYNAEMTNVVRKTSIQ